MACIPGGCVELSFLVPHYFIIISYIYMHDYSLPFSVLASRMCHVIVHLIIPFVPLLYCSVVIHMHILPCTLVVIILVLFRTSSKSPDNAYRYIYSNTTVTVLSHGSISLSDKKLIGAGLVAMVLSNLLRYCLIEASACLTVN